MKTRNPFLAIVFIVAALGALAMAFMVGMILLSVVAVAGLALTAGYIVRQKLGRGRPALDHATRASAHLDPAMEVRPVQGRVGSGEDQAPPD